MKEYIFKIISASNAIKWVTVNADSIKAARKQFKNISYSWGKGWGVLAVYKEL